jgi:hypothetical protein
MPFAQVLATTFPVAARKKRAKKMSAWLEAFRPWDVRGTRRS